MQTAKKNSSVRRRRKGNRHASRYRIRNRVGTSFGQPVHIGFYLNPVLDSEGNADRGKIVELFNTESYA
jgi:hypothetical protein